MKREEMLSSIMNILSGMKIDTEIEPERIRPPLVHSGKRRDLKTLEDELRLTMDELEQTSFLGILLSRLANLHLQEGNFSSAILLYERGLRIEPKQPEAWTNLGLAKILSNDSDTAIGCLDTAIELDSGNSRAHCFKGLAHLKQGSVAEAKRIFTEVVDYQPKCERALIGLGLCHKKRGEIDKAISWFMKADMENSGSLAADLELGKLYLEQREYRKAEEAFHEAAKMDGGNPAAIIGLGDAQFGRRKYDEALYFYNKALTAVKDNPNLWLKKGDAHKMNRSYEEAAEAYQKAIQADSEYIPGWIKAAQVYVLMKDTGTALEFFNTVISLAPDNADVVHQRGLVNLSIGNLEAALADFDKAFSVDASNPEHLYYRASILEKLERFDEAMRTWQIARDLYGEIDDTTREAECNAKMKRLKRVHNLREYE